MRYPIAIELGYDTTAWGVVVPDLPGCFSTGDSLEEVVIQAEYAITGLFEAAVDDGQDTPASSHIEALRAAHREFEGWLWALVKVDPAMLDDTLEREISASRAACCPAWTLAPAVPAKPALGFITRIAVVWPQVASV